MNLNIPTYLTFLRIVLIPVFMLFYYLPWRWGQIIALIIFIIAALTDLLDGYLARKMQLTSKFGEFLDPIADKLMVAVALIVLAANPHLPYLALPIAVIISREIVVSGLREWMAELGKRTSVAVSYLGKVKTTVQLVAIAFLVGCNPLYYDWRMLIGYLGIYLAAILTVWSMIVYLRIAWPEFKINS